MFIYFLFLNNISSFQPRVKRQQDILLKQQNSVAKEEKVGFSDPDEEALNKIKQLLNPKVRLERKSVFVPEELNKVMLRLKPYVEQMGIVLSDTINIQYGKKLLVWLRLRLCRMVYP